MFTAKLTWMYRIFWAFASLFLSHIGSRPYSGPTCTREDVILYFLTTQRSQVTNLMSVCCWRLFPAWNCFHRGEETFPSWVSVSGLWKSTLRFLFEHRGNCIIITQECESKIVVNIEYFGKSPGTFIPALPDWLGQWPFRTSDDWVIRGCS